MAGPTFSRVGIESNGRATPCSINPTAALHEALAGWESLAWGRKVKMETTIVYWGYIGIMENKMETTIVYWGYM